MIADNAVILAVDTATRIAGLSLYSKERVLAEEAWYSFGNHTVELLPALSRMLDREHLQPKDLGGLVVSLGPGSFTGLRIGLSVVKGLAMALDVPLIGVATLDAAAYAHAPLRLPTWAVVEAGRQRYAAALYGFHKGGWGRLNAYRIARLEMLAPHEQQKTLYCGEIDGKAQDTLRESFADLALFPTSAATLRRPAFLAELGWQRLAAGERDDVVSLSPIYLQHPVSEAPA